MQDREIQSETAFSLPQVCEICHIESQLVHDLTEDGVIETYLDPSGRRWLAESGVRRIQIYLRIRKDIGANHEGAEFAVLLVEELRTLRERQNQVPVNNGVMT